MDEIELAEGQDIASAIAPYEALNKPVVIRGVFSILGSGDSILDGVVEEFGEKILTVGPHRNTKHEQQCPEYRDITLAQHIWEIRNTPNEACTQNYFTRNDAAAGRFNFLKKIRSMLPEHIGFVPMSWGNNTLSGFHGHGRTYFGMLYGYKQVYVVAPEDAHQINYLCNSDGFCFNEDEAFSPENPDFSDTYPNVRKLTFYTALLGEGDFMYLPGGGSEHQVIGKSGTLSFAAY